MGEPTFGAKCAAEIRAELGLLDDDQEQFVANLIDRHHATSQGRLSGFALEHSSPVRHGSRKLREELFDALCGVCNIQREGMTKPMARSVSVALTAIMAVMPNLTTNEIVLRAREYRRKHPTWELTPTSLAKHWGSCATQESIRGLLDEPTGWRSHHAQIFPELGDSSGFIASQPWSKIGRALQEKAIRWMTQRNVVLRQPHAD